jgi:hypothetical protein
MDFCPNKTEKGPVKSQIQHKDDICEYADSYGQIAIMSRHKRNPVNQNSIECTPCKKSHKKRLFWAFVPKNYQQWNE